MCQPGLSVSCADLHLAARVAPADFHRQRLTGRDIAQTEMKLRRALARHAVAAVDLGGQAPAVRQQHLRFGTDGRPFRACPQPHGRPAPTPREQQLEAEKGVLAGVVIAVEVGIFPLVGEHEVEVAVPVHVGDGDAARDHRLAEADQLGDVEVFSGRIAARRRRGVHGR